MLIRGGQVLDKDAGRFHRRDILIGDGIFSAVGERLEGEQVLDAAGLWILPGLIDAHVHVISVEDDLRRLHREPPYLVAAKSARVLDAMLARGFTSVRDAGGADGSIAEAVETGLFAGPRIFPAGRGFAQSGGQGDYRTEGEEEMGCLHCGGTRTITSIADGADALRRAVRQEIAAGATQIKVMASGGVASPGGPEALQYSDEELRAVVQEAGAAGTYVMAHAYGSAAIRRCLESGVRSIEHGSGLDEPTAALMAECGAVLVPTLVVFDHLSKSGGNIAGIARRIFDESCKSIELARRHGVAVAHGSDLAGSEHRYQSSEFRLKAALMPIRDVIASATSVGARLLPQGSHFGVIEPGAIADLVAFDANPLLDIETIAMPDRHLKLVVKNGAIAVDRLAGTSREASRS